MRFSLSSTLRCSLAALVTALLVISCSSATPTPIPTVIPTNPPLTAVPTTPPTPTSEPKPAFRVVGYITDWGVPVAETQVDKLTHINYAFALPRTDGTIDFPANAWKMQGYVAMAHAKDIKVLISVGGWGLDKEFEAFAASPELRKVFVKSLMDYVDSNQLDGADIDWEYPIPGKSTHNFRALMHELRVELDARKKLLTAAVAAYGENADGVTGDIFPLLDFVNVMAYADEGAHHSTYDLSVRALDYWQGRGLDPNKTVLGVPFYGMPGDVPYRKIVGSDAAAAQTEFSRYLGSDVGYNGLTTMRKKTILAMERASGVMVWTINDDTTDDTSLLNAIQETAAGK